MKNKLLIPFLLIFFWSSAFSQDKYFTRTGTISFFSESPMENIEAINHQVSSILDTQNGEIAVSAQMKGFEFEKALMQEHFNENYIESDKFPTATFKGTVIQFDITSLKENEPQEFDVEGELTIHGVTRPIKSKVRIVTEGNLIKGTSVFNIAVKDYDIKIPKAVINNIAEEVKTTIKLNLEPFQR